MARQSGCSPSETKPRIVLGVMALTELSLQRESGSGGEGCSEAGDPTRRGAFAWPGPARIGTQVDARVGAPGICVSMWTVIRWGI
jgi:hypothetical protein